MYPTRKAKQRGLDSLDYYKKRGKEKQREKSKEADVPKDCVVCLEIIEVQGSISACNHLFCFVCIFEWSKRTNTCPLCKKQFRCITKKSLLYNGSPPRTFRVKDKEQSFHNETADDYDVAMGLYSESDLDISRSDDSDYEVSIQVQSQHDVSSRSDDSDDKNNDLSESSASETGSDSSSNPKKVVRTRRQPRRQRREVTKLQRSISRESIESSTSSVSTVSSTRSYNRPLPATDGWIDMSNKKDLVKRRELPNRNLRSVVLERSSQLLPERTHGAATSSRTSRSCRMNNNQGETSSQNSILGTRDKTSTNSRNRNVMDEKSTRSMTQQVYCQASSSLGRSTSTRSSRNHTESRSRDENVAEPSKRVVDKQYFENYSISENESENEDALFSPVVLLKNIGGDIGKNKVHRTSTKNKINTSPVSSKETFLDRLKSTRLNGHIPRNGSLKHSSTRSSSREAITHNGSEVSSTNTSYQSSTNDIDFSILNGEESNEDEDESKGKGCSTRSNQPQKLLELKKHEKCPTSSRDMDETEYLPNKKEHITHSHDQQGKSMQRLSRGAKEKALDRIGEGFEVLVLPDMKKRKLNHSYFTRKKKPKFYSSDDDNSDNDICWKRKVSDDSDFETRNTIQRKTNLKSHQTQSKCRFPRGTKKKDNCSSKKKHRSKNNHISDSSDNASNSGDEKLSTGIKDSGDFDYETRNRIQTNLKDQQAKSAHGHRISRSTKEKALDQIKQGLESPVSKKSKKRTTKSHSIIDSSDDASNSEDEKYPTSIENSVDSEYETRNRKEVTLLDQAKNAQRPSRSAKMKALDQIEQNGDSSDNSDDVQSKKPLRTNYLERLSPILFESSIQTYKDDDCSSDANLFSEEESLTTNNVTNKLECNIVDDTVDLDFDSKHAKNHNNAKGIMKERSCNGVISSSDHENVDEMNLSLAVIKEKKTLHSESRNRTVVPSFVSNSPKLDIVELKLTETKKNIRHTKNGFKFRKVERKTDTSWID